MYFFFPCSLVAHQAPLCLGCLIFSCFECVLTELQRGPGGGRAQGSVQLYDTPYEDKRGQRLGLMYADVYEEGKESSRLPQDDERPADEYDQPWEWKKDHISKAFAGAKKSHFYSENITMITHTTDTRKLNK